MALPALHVANRRYVIPIAIAAAIAAAVAVPQLASGVAHPVLPPRTAAQLLASLEGAHAPDFTGTVVETTRLGLPNISDSGVASSVGGNGGPLAEITSLLSGSHTAQIAYGGPDRQRVAIFLNDLSETDIVHNGADVWTYSSQDNAVSHSRHPAEHDSSAKTGSRIPGVADALSPQQSAKRALAAIDPSTAVTVDRTAEVAGRPAYQLVLSPRNPKSLIGSVRIALDSATSMPLRTEIWSRSAATSPAFEVAFTSLHLGMPAASTFAFTAPPGAKVGSNPLLPPDETRAPNPASSNPPAKTTFHAVGNGWLRVLVGKVPPLSPKSTAPPSTAQALTNAVGNLASPVAGGQLLHTPLFSVLLTNDGRIFVGAVSATYLEQLAAYGTKR